MRFSVPREHECLARWFAKKMTLRAFLALRVIGMQWKSCRKEVVNKIESSQTKSKISQNLNWELDTGAIFTPSLGPKVSRNVFGVSVYAFWRNPSVSTVFL